MEIDRNRKTFRKIVFFMDTINMVLDIAILIIGVWILIDFKEHAGMFPVLFGFAAIMNLIMGIKYHMREEKIRAIAMLFVAGLLFAVSLISYLSTGN